MNILLKILIISFLSVVWLQPHSQILYYSDTFNGGTTASGWAPDLGGSGTGNFDIQIFPGATIHQAYLIGCGHGANNNFTVTLNGDNVTFTAANEASTFPDPTYGGNCIVSIVDVTALIDPAVNDYTITSPFQDGDNGFEGYMLYVAYEHASLDLINTYIYLNDQAMSPSEVTWNLTGMEPYPATGNIAVSMMFDYACQWDGDGEYVDVNGTYIGNCGGVDYNSGNCASILGSYYYENGTAFGLGNDTPDGNIAAGDALWIADSYINAGDTGMDLVMYDGPTYSGFDNGFYLALFTYGSACDIPPYTISADTTICPGQSAQLLATGGISYTWTPAATLDDAASPSPIATPAATTTYDVLIDFDNGCSITEEVIVTVNTNALTIETEIVNPLCSGNGSIEVTDVQGDSGVLTYFLDGITQSGPMMDDLAPATYEITVTDALGCSGTITQEIITDTYVVDFDLDIINQYCEVSGQIEIISVNNGQAPFVFDLDGTIEADSVFENLTAGNYSITVTDNIGCSGTQDIGLIQENAVVTFDPIITDVICSGVGSIEITNVNGLTGNIVYALNGVDQPGPVFSNLPPDDYDVTMSDELGCVFDTNMEVELITYIIDFDVENTNQLCFTPGQLEVISINNGTSPYSYSLNGTIEPDGLFENLTAGNYDISISDTLGCSGTQVIAVVMENPVLNFDVVINNAICQSPGSAEVVNPDGLAPFVLSANNVPQPGLMADSLLSGTYDLLLVDANGCSGATEVEIFYVDTSSAMATYTSLNGGIPLTVNFTNESVGLTDFVWSFDNGDSLFTADASYTYNLPGNYTVELFGYDSLHGCFDSTSFEVIAGIYAVHIPNAFSPDGDGINEIFAPVTSGVDPDYFIFQVFDRWGQVVFETNDLTKAWTGSVLGGNYFAQTGVYVYHLEYRFLNSIDWQEASGHVTVIR